MKTNIIKKALSFIAAAFITIAASDAQAVTFLWNNTGTNWTSPTSWVNGAQPTATTSSGTDVVQFSNLGESNNRVELTSNRTPQKLEFLSTANAYTFTSTWNKLLEISSGGLTNASASAQIFDVKVNQSLPSSNGNLAWYTGTGSSLIFNKQVGLTTATGSTARSLTLTGDGTYTFNGNVINNGNLVNNLANAKLIYTGGGTMNLNGTNTIGFDSQSSSGLLVSGTGNVVVGAGGLLNVSSSQTHVNSGVLKVQGTAGKVLVEGTGTVWIDNGTIGNTTVSAGGILKGTGTTGDLTLNGGTLAPGNSPGLLTVANLNGNNGIFAFELGAPTTRGVTYDAINVSGLLTLGNSTAWTFSVLDNYAFQDADAYDLFNFDSIDAAAFDSAVLLAALPTLSDGLQWNVSSFTTDGIVNVIPEPSTYASLLIGLILLALMKTKTKTKASLLAALLAVFSLNTTHAAVLGIESASNYTSATWTEGAGSNVGTWYFQNDTAAVTQIADSSQGGRTSIGTDAFNFVPGNTAFNQFANGWFALNGGGLIAGQTLSVDANYLWNGGNRGVEFMSGNAAVFRLQHVWSDPITFAGTGLTDTQVLANGYQQALTYSVDQLDQLSVQVSAYLYGSSSALFTQTVAVPDYITGIHFFAGDVTTTAADQPNYGLFVNNIEVSGIPEPSAGSLMLLGSAALLALKKLKRKEARI
jgi:hypothetical protein